MAFIGTASRIDVDELKQATRGQWREILASVGGIDPALLDGRHHACPKCGGVDRFRMLDEQDGALICNQCFAEQNGDGLAAVQWLIGCNFSDAINRVASFLNNGQASTAAKSSKPLPNNNGSQKPKPFDEQVIWHDSKEPADEQFGTRMFELWATAKPPIVVDAIRASEARFCQWPRKAHQPHWCIAFPAQRTHAGDIVGWILYRADGTNFPEIPNGPGERKTHMLRGSKDGWVVVGGWDALKEASVVVKVEGVPDALAIHPQLPDGAVVVTNICGCKSIKLPLSQFKGKRLIVIGDADVPGTQGAEQCANHAATKIDDVRIEELPFEIVDDHGKDVRDFVSDGGNVAELLAEAVPVDHSDGQSSTASPTDDENVITNVLKSSDYSVGTPVPMADILAKIYERTDNWPRRMGPAVFIHEPGQRVAFLEKPSALFGWLGAATGQPPKFVAETGCHTKSEVYAEVQRTAMDYEAVEEVVHEPKIPGHYYACSFPKAGDGSKLCGLVDRFTPDTDIDADLITAMFVTVFCVDRIGGRARFANTVRCRTTI